MSSFYCDARENVFLGAKFKKLSPENLHITENNYEYEKAESKHYFSHSGMFIEYD